MEMTIYAVMDADEQYVGEDHYRYQDACDFANERARVTERPHAVIEQTWVMDDSELAYATDGSDVWPPEVDEGDDSAVEEA